MALRAGFRDLTGLLPNMPGAVTVGANIGFPSFGAGYTALVGPATTAGDVGVEFAGARVNTPELFLGVGVQFNVHPVVLAAIESGTTNAPGPNAFRVANLGTAKANLSIGRFLYTRQRVRQWMDDVEEGNFGYFDTVEHGRLYLHLEETTETPASVGFSLALWGLRWIGGDESLKYEFVPLGGGGEVTYRVANDVDVLQTVEVDVGKLLQAAVRYEGEFIAFCWIVVPEDNVPQVIDISDPDAVVNALRAMYTSGELAEQNFGTDGSGHPVNVIVGDITAVNLYWNGAGIDEITFALTGEMALPGAAAPAVYAPPMTAVLE